MTFNKTFRPLLLAATLAATPACAFDSSDPFGMNGAQADMPAKAVREKNDGHFLEDLAKNVGTGLGVGAAGGALMGAAVLNPLFIVGGSLVIGNKIAMDRFANVNAFYSGTITRGKVNKVENDYNQSYFGVGSGFIQAKLRIFPDKTHGFDLRTFPSNEVLSRNFDVLHLDVDGSDGATVFALAHKISGIKKGDIVDVNSPVGVFTLNTRVFDNLHYDFNKHMPRVVNVYCKHDNPVCQNDFESSLGVLSRHQDKEFPPSQYLIDPTIIAADQAKMRKEAEESKAASNSGGFSFM